MKNEHILLLVLLLFGGYYGVTNGYIKLGSISTSIPGTNQNVVTTTTVGGIPTVTGATYTITAGLRAPNGTGLSGYSVDLYHYDAAGQWWIKDERCTSASGAFTSTSRYMPGQEIYVNIPHVATFVPDYWVKVVVQPWQGNPFTTCTVKVTGEAYLPNEVAGQITVPTATLSAAHTTMRLYGEDSTAISTTQVGASYTSRSKATGLANMEGRFELEVLTAAWQTFGGAFDVPKTNQGASARRLTSVFQFEVNATGFSFDTTRGVNGKTWTLATASSASYRRYVIEVPRVETRETYPVILQIPFYADFSGMTSNTGYSIACTWTDQQLYADAVNGIIYAGSGANIGYMVSDTATFYVYITA